MPFLRPREERPEFNTKVRSHTIVRCPLNGHQVGACRGLCDPAEDGHGLCGRLAPHALVGRLQEAIAAQKGEEVPLRLRTHTPRRPPRALTPRVR